MRNYYYQRLSSEDREEISRGLVIGLSIRDIAVNLARVPSTISREVHKGSANRYTYRAHRAQKRASWNARCRRGGKYKLIGKVELRKYVHAKLRIKRSPCFYCEISSNEHPLPTRYCGGDSANAESGSRKLTALF